MTVPELYRLFTRCWDDKCYQRESCARWTRREAVGAPLHVDTLRTPSESLEKPCAAYIGVSLCSGCETGHLNDRQRSINYWAPCPDCDEYWCNLHHMHAFECDCPPVEYWLCNPYLSVLNSVPIPYQEQDNNGRVV